MNPKELTLDRAYELVGSRVLAIPRPTESIVIVKVSWITVDSQGIIFNCCNNRREKVDLNVSDIVSVLDDNYTPCHELEAFAEFLRIRSSIEECLLEFTHEIYGISKSYRGFFTIYESDGDINPDGNNDLKEFLSRIKSIITTNQIIEPLRLLVNHLGDRIVFKLVFDKIQFCHEFRIKF